MKHFGLWLFVSLPCFSQISLDRTGFVPLSELAPDVVMDMRYTTAFNFIGEPVQGYQAAVCWLTREAAEALANAQEELRAEGFSLKIYDCYRPQRAVDHFVRWASDLEEQRMKPIFYPSVNKDQLFSEGYIAERSGHSRGSTVDLTLVELPLKPREPFRDQFELLPDCRANQGQNPFDESVEMGTAYDCFDPLSHTASEAVSKRAAENRQRLKRVMERHGFVNYSAEWWHYTLKNEPFPETYFDFPVTEPD